MEKPVILQVVAALDQGGVEQGTLDMARYTVQQGWTSLVASAGGRLVMDLERAGAQHFRLPLQQRNPVAILYNALRLASLVRRHGVDLMHTRSRAPAWATRIASRLTGVPYITSFHGTHRIQNRLKWRYNNVMTSGLLTIANSRFIRQHIRQHYGLAEDRLRLAQRGIDTTVFDPDKLDAEDLAELRSRWQLDGSPLILMPGRLTRWKGQAVFIAALDRIRDLPWQALIAGGADRKDKYAAELRALAAGCGLQERVRFTGSLDNLARLYALADITVSASTEPEAFGRVAVESQAMGTPVIVTAHGGSMETVRDGETGLLAEPGSVDSLAVCLRELLADPARRKLMGEAGRAHVLAHFTVERMCEQEFSVYREILGAAG